MVSPQSFIDFSWYFTVGTFLSRRVWLGDFESALFANLFIINVAPAGVGKSLAVDKAKDLISSIIDDKAKEIRHPGGIMRKPQYIKLCANSTTFASIIEEMCRCVRPDTRSYKGALIPYIYTPFSFIEDELSALLRDSEGRAIAKFLLKAYDCKNYDYQTRMHQKEQVLSPFSSLLCGTTPSFLQEAADSGIFADGFSSRCCWLFEGRARSFAARLTKMTDEQRSEEELLRTRLKKIITIKGEVKESEESKVFFDAWALENVAPAIERSTGPMRDYFARKITHIHKLAMCIHFSDYDDMTIGIDAYKEAIRVLESIEPKMRLGLNMLGRNPLSNFTDSLLKFVQGHRNKGVTHTEILAQFIGDLNQKEIMEILDVLLALDRIYVANSRYIGK